MNNMESIGNLQFTVGEEVVNLDVSVDDSGENSYYVVDIQRECFEKIFASMESVKTSSLGIEQEEREKFFPYSGNSDAVMAGVVITDNNGVVLRDEKVNFKPRAYLKMKVPMIVRNVSAMVKEVFDRNPGTESVIVMVAVDGERITTGFEGVVADEETGEF